MDDNQLMECFIEYLNEPKPGGPRLRQPGQGLEPLRPRLVIEALVDQKIERLAAEIKRTKPPSEVDLIKRLISEKAENEYTEAKESLNKKHKEKD